MSKPVNTVPSILRIPILATRTQRDHLAKLLAMCNIARNCTATYWRRWREDNPDYVRGTYQPTKGPNKGKDKDEHNSGYASHECENEMYHASASVVPHLGTDLRGMVAAEIRSDLTDKMPWNHRGKAKFRWQAIIWHEAAQPNYAERTIPVHNNPSIFGWKGKMVPGSTASKANKARVEVACKSQAVMCVPAFSEESGCPTYLLLRLGVGAMSAGQKLILENILARTEGQAWKIADSSIVEKDGKWYWHMAYHQPVAHALDESRVACLSWCKPDERKPFLVECHGEKPWLLGDVLLYERETDRFKARRAHLRQRWTKGVRGQSGHGRGRFYERVRPSSDLLRNLQERFRALLIDEIIRYCKRHDCGTLVVDYARTLARGKMVFDKPVQSWFSTRRLEFGWELFHGRLAYKVQANGIKFSSGEGDGKKPGAARNADGGSGNGHAPKAAGSGRGAGPKKASRSRGSVKGKPKTAVAMTGVARRS